MGRRSKRLRAQLYQYAQDEAGSYSVITQWQPPATTPTPPPRECVSKRCVVISVVVMVIACVVVVAVGVGLGVSRGSLVDQSRHKDPVGLWRIWSNGEEEEGGGRIPSRFGEFPQAAVSTDGQPCAQVTMDILRKNGTAADAAIAGLLCIGVTNTQSAGLGGGFLMTYYEQAASKAYTLDAREARPSGGSLGGSAIAVPGALRGYRQLYERLGGGLPWAELLRPTIKLCEEGHPVSPHLARTLRTHADTILSHPTMSVFINPTTGTVYQEGDIVTRPQLANTLRLLQQDSDALYTGPLAESLTQDIQNLGGTLTKEDLKQYRPVWKDPVRVNLQHGGFTMYSSPSPSSGLVLGFILNVLDEYGLTPDSLNDQNVVLTHHRVAEAMKWAYPKDTTLRNSVNVTELPQYMTSDAFAASIRHLIQDDKTFNDLGHYGAAPAGKIDPGTARTFLDDPDSAHISQDDCGIVQFSLMAPNGDAVSVTSGINSCLGARVRSRQTGLLLNNVAADLPHHRSPPATSSSGGPADKSHVCHMSPTVFVDARGDVRLVISGAGEGWVAWAATWMALRTLWLGERVTQAVHAPRMHLRMHPMAILYEEGLSPEIVAGLHAKGHNMEKQSENSAIYAVARENGRRIHAVADFRRGGATDGF
ncbi:scoloptoxin SSD14-like [Homarus americanus]|uniref:scoloptoxin SSD14-like n=1 Tax=Homarus americanus TaxID=6706 RepID=UPI001C46DEC6|nr:scoloptoxin SSD14-like [Homarus americanus]XP_042208206.1 scoloptoxin SSD14-like [Homarus americanus]XP_042208207.1 scoloptoxin SSD14-like [Homarus americanus]XP_042208208.1 scoloptoxin SSD14-like [Homarus americanus]XP_042208209.1 scoloptoxin SSD14-like [Homarus americanus]